MNPNKVYILHKNGANSHYIGLDHLLKQHDSQLIYREFSVLGTFFKSLVKLDFKKVTKQIINAFFLVSLLMSKNKKVVLAIAPYDQKLGRLLSILKNHQIYYHTSWTYWDGTFHPKTKKNSPKVFATWKGFIENKCRHIFVVTQKSKNELIANYDIDTSKISVVNHSLNPQFLEDVSATRIRNSFIYLGRLLPQKGIDEMLDFFSKHPESNLTIIGQGKLENLVKEAAAKHSNINYKKHTNNIKELTQELSTNEFLLLNSKRTKKWEELFGLIIIEGMAQGLIPIAPTHSGPKEIITPEIGHLFEEGNLKSMLNEIISLENFDKKMSNAAKEKASMYRPEHIATKWKSILA